ncbi:hypothetical protein ACFLQN_02245 [Candidatus Aenigmatarchaeota archaeon]
MRGFDFYVHGLWILGSITMFLGAMIAGNVEWVDGTTTWSFGLAIIIAFVLILISGAFWISAAVNAKQYVK